MNRPGFPESSPVVIDAAVGRMPEPYWRISGPALAATLKQRRAGIGKIAEESYEQTHH
jgi:hypothetical protein